MSATSTFIVRTECSAYCRERWRVTIPADTPEDELRGVLHEALNATGDFLDQDVDGEHDREITDYEEERASAPAPGPIDHAARAKRATEIIDGESHVRDIEDWRPVKYADPSSERTPLVVLPDCEEEAEDLRGANPLVEFQFLSTSYDGTDCWIGFHESLDDAAEYLASEAMGEVPWAPGDIYDLDTGAHFTTAVAVTTRATGRVIA